MAVSKHQVRMTAEFTRLRVRKGFGTLEAFRAFVDARENDSMQGTASNAAPTQKQSRVRWVRVNTLGTTLEEQLKTTFSDFHMVHNLADVMKATTSSETTQRLLFVDGHIPNLLAIPRKIDLSETPAYTDGHLIFQDKASCFPASLLDVSSLDGDIIDACAAPGNKTSHLASLLREKESSASGKRRIFAIEKDKARSTTLERMMRWTGADSIVTIRAAKDFTQLDPLTKDWRRVDAILLDPSCSGNGILDRDDGVDLILPEQDRRISKHPLQLAQKPRRRKQPQRPASPSSPDPTRWLASRDDEQKSRLTSLATFQLKLLTHAFRFDSARRVVYSTCSINEIENEQVVINALNSQEAKGQGWEILRREDQSTGLRSWDLRGNLTAFQGAMNNDHLAAELADACIRCPKGGDQGTIGFFAVGFVRAASSRPQRTSVGTPNQVDSEEEWNGFSDEDEKGVE
ncbi:MAG: hypothetical protein M1816_002251 [Peltula sp. TS41687]|nr:MAG: hypothetical protein M1816_002251 [Peltula sp. TS41687]